MTSYTNAHPNQPPLDGEEFAPFPGDNPALIGASAGSSTFVETPGYNQAQIEAWWQSMVQTLQQFNVPLHETQAHGTGVHLPTSPVQEEPRIIRTQDGKTRHVCAECGKDFGRVQEVRRHMKDKHEPRRRCPFCDVTWTRPDKIKSHILKKHAEGFAPEILEWVKASCGQDVVEFVNGYPGVGETLP